MLDIQSQSKFQRNHTKMHTLHTYDFNLELKSSKHRVSKTCVCEMCHSRVSETRDTVAHSCYITVVEG